MLFFKAVIFGMGFYFGIMAMKGIDHALTERCGKFLRTKTTKIETEVKKTTRRPIGFNAKWEEP